MNSISIFYGPKKAFDLYISEAKIDPEEITSFSSLVRKSDEARRELNIVNGSAAENVKKEPLYVKHLVAYSDDYASVQEHVILNFEGFISEFSIDAIFLHNPPELLANKILKTYPTTKVDSYEYPRLKEDTIRKINSDYDQTIIGQTNVKNELMVSLIPLTRKNFNKPVVILFFGPSGVGKTETAKYLAKSMGGELFRKQLSMFQNNDFIVYLFGGHHYEKSFAKELLERETNVILLDEFDKAPPVFHSAFYQLFDEGVFNDKNYSVNIGNPIIICTSNYNSLEEIRKNLGDPIFSRFDSCIQFSELDKKSIETIIKLRISNEWASLSDEDKLLVNIQEIEHLFESNIHKIKNARRITSLVREVVSSKILSRILRE